MKEIIFDRETRDYAAYLDGDLIGFFANHHDAEVELDRLALERIKDEARAVVVAGPAEIVPDKDDDDDYEDDDYEPRENWVYARPAEVEEPVYVLTDADLLAQARGAETQHLIDLFNHQVPTAYAATALYHRLAQALRPAIDAGDNLRIERLLKLMNRAGRRMDRRGTAAHYDRYERSLETWLHTNHADSWIAGQMSQPATYTRPADVAEPPIYVAPTAGLDRAVKTDPAAPTAALPITDRAVAAALEHLAEREAASARHARARSHCPELTEEQREEVKAEAKFFQRAANAYTRALLYWDAGVRPDRTDAGNYVLPSQRQGEPPHLLHMDGDWVCTCAAGATAHWAKMLIIGLEAAQDALEAGTVGEPDPQWDVCPSCGDQLPVPTVEPSLCPACREAGEQHSDMRPTLEATLGLLASDEAAIPLPEHAPSDAPECCGVPMDFDGTTYQCLMCKHWRWA